MLFDDATSRPCLCQLRGIRSSEIVAGPEWPVLSVWGNFSSYILEYLGGLVKLVCLTKPLMQVEPLPQRNAYVRHTHCLSQRLSSSRKCQRSLSNK